jgi:hypothetical protein
MSIEKKKAVSQFLETGLQTPPPSFFLETSFYQLLKKTSFYKSSEDPNRPLIY